MDFLAHTLYRLPTPVPRSRTKPMQVLCVGLPRTGTESLQSALMILGYDYTYHGYDVIFETPSYAPLWAALASKKFCRGEKLTREDFDTVLGHCQAVTDSPCAAFLPDIVEAYPSAKVILNYREDKEAWHASVVKTLLHQSYENWAIYLSTFFSAEAFWSWHVYYGFLHPGLWGGRVGGWTRSDFRAAVMGPDGRNKSDQYMAYVKSIVPKDNLLLWRVEDGWEPLCKFLGKQVPDVPFPHANTAQQGFGERVEQWKREVGRKTLRNVAVTVSVLAVGIVAVAKPSTAKQYFHMLKMLMQRS